MFGRQQRLNEWRYTRTVSEGIVAHWNYFSTMYRLRWYCWAILSGGPSSELRPIYKGCRALTFALARLSCFCSAVWAFISLHQICYSFATAFIQSILLSESHHHLTPSNVTSKLTTLPRHNTHHLATPRTSDLFFNFVVLPNSFTLHLFMLFQSCSKFEVVTQISSSQEHNGKISSPCTDPEPSKFKLPPSNFHTQYDRLSQQQLGVLFLKMMSWWCQCMTWKCTLQQIRIPVWTSMVVP